eukprot:TRINITY_DN3389_c0_g5_i1.p3 TRINITY_DN3389_c0_g5~~TRINITY_DN3389_c0_g5_i1.p3  ORF type:complete len:104 (+),score=9.41 TRINITY_DN3389_c0_g5_i1:145-456(+)
MRLSKCRGAGGACRLTAGWRLQGRGRYNRRYIRSDGRRQRRARRTCFRPTTLTRIPTIGSSVWRITWDPRNTPTADIFSTAAAAFRRPTDVGFADIAAGTLAN